MDEPPARAGIRDTYDRIAAHFSETRAHPWPEVEAFLADRHGDVAVDVGCGNGRHAAPLADHADRVLGVDISPALLGEARSRLGDRAVGLCCGDAASLPVRTGVADLAVYVATVHHLPERRLRVRSLDELARVLAPAGTALVSAWSTEHDRFEATEGFDTTIDWTLPGGEVVDRFYHIYDPGEFRTEIADSDLAAEDVFVSSGNCYARVVPERKGP